MKTKRTLSFEIFSLSVCILIPALALAIALIRLHSYWDDGAITASFARTFQQTGFLALTPNSEHIEGTSSLLWMLVLSLGSYFLRSPDGMLIWSKVAAALAFSATLFLFEALAKRFLSPMFVCPATLLLALTETPFVETLNGMEMNLYALLVSALALVFIRMYSQPPNLRALPGWCVAFVLSNAILLARFESVFVLLFMYIGAWLRWHKPRVLAILAATNLAFFGLVEFWRFRQFHSWVPNTVLAKRWSPYSPSDLPGKLLSRLDATSEIFTVLLVPISMCGAFWLTNALNLLNKREKRDDASDPFLISMTAGAFVLCLVLGKNWGHPGRMVLAFMPFILLLVLRTTQQLCSSLHLDATRLLLTLTICQAMLWAYQTRLSIQTNPASYSAVEQTGLAAELIRSRLQRPTLSVFIPDVGASSLCCSQLQIMDSALLTNSSLARQGYQGVPSFLSIHRPEFIETHGSWAADGGLYEKGLLGGYGLVHVHSKFVFVRNDLYAELKHNKHAHVQASCLGLNDAANMRPRDVFFLNSRLNCVWVD